MAESDYMNLPFEPVEVYVPDVRFYVAGMAVAGYMLGRTITYADANYTEEVRFDNPDYPNQETLVYSGACVGFEHNEHEDFAETLRNDIVCRLAGVYTLKMIEKEDTSEICADDDKYFVPRCQHEYLFCRQVPKYCEVRGLYDNRPFESSADMTREERDRYTDWVMDQESSVTQEMWDEAGRIIRDNEDLVASLAVGLVENGYLFGSDIHESLGYLEARRPSSN